MAGIDEDKEHPIEIKIRPGSIVYLYCDFLGNPHFKYLILVHLEEDYVLGFFINSKVFGSTKDNPRLLMSQIPITSAELPFLDHDSFIDCLKTIDDFEPSEIQELVDDNPGIYFGEIDKAIVDAIFIALDNSITLSNVEIRRITNSLRQYY